MDGTATLLVTFGALLLVGLAAKTVGRLAHVPGVTLLLLLGVAIGPAALDLLPEQRGVWFPLFTRVALLFIGFLLGHEFTSTSLRDRGREVLVVSLAVTLATAGLVSAGLALLGEPLAMALLVGVIATATDPAATVAVAREQGADGPFTRSLLGVVAIDDVWGLTLFGVTAPLAAWLVGGGGGFGLALHAVREVGGALLLGVGLGLPMAFLTGRLRPGEPTRLEALGLVLLCGGLASALGVSYLLAAVAMGATVANVARHHEIAFHEIENVDAPILVAFFILAGAALDLPALARAGPVVLAYVLLRVLGRVLGAAVGARAVGAPATTRRWMGLALLPQAGVALGLALAVHERFPALGVRILPLVIGATVLFEIGGPITTRLALRRVGESAA